MKYAFLIYDDPTSWESLPEDEALKFRAQEMPRWEAAMGELASVDPNFEGYELESRSTAKVVRVRDGERMVTDGPFAETKEVIGGFFVADVPDLDDAIRLGAQIPSAEGGSIEIRPVLG
ncbi:MAG: YciI family protein [Actinobacteria bacterium]|nr:MAG: YciI family protein [Actinomycetota bacterium]